MKLILDVNDQAVLDEVKAVLQNSEDNFYDHLPEQLKRSIARGISDIEKGNLKPHEEVMQKFKDKYVSKH